MSGDEVWVNVNVAMQMLWKKNIALVVKNTSSPDMMSKSSSTGFERATNCYRNQNQSRKGEDTMTRINIQVDLKEKEVLEKQLKKEFEGIARGMAREAMQGELEKEINRLIDNKLEEAKKTDYYNHIANNITRIVAHNISRDVKIDTAEVNKLVQEKVEAYLNNLMVPYGGTQRFIENFINKSIADALKKK